jgi:flap endonuclease-1
MGIKHMHKFIKKSGNIVEEKPNIFYFGKTIAIDISILVYKLVIAIRNTGNDLLNKDGEIVSHIIGLYNKALTFLELGIRPIFVFDGKPPDIKQTIIKNRKETRKRAQEKMDQAENDEDKIKYFKRTVHIPKQQMEDCKQLLNLMGLPVVQAPQEADSQCAYLAKSGIVWAVLTEDMDILTFGSPRIIRNFGTKNKPTTEIELDKILKKYNIDHKQFVDLCILFGCDYCPNIKGMNQFKAFQLIKRYGSIEKIKENVVDIPKTFEYDQIKQYFMDPKVTLVDDLDLKFKIPDYKGLNNFLVNRFKLSKPNISKKIDRLRHLYESNIRLANISVCS